MCTVQIAAFCFQQKNHSGILPQDWASLKFRWAIFPCHVESSAPTESPADAPAAGGGTDDIVPDDVVAAAAVQEKFGVACVNQSAA